MGEVKNPLVALIGGIIFTMILVIVVPVIVYTLIEPVITPMIEDAMGDGTYLGWFTSSLVAAIVMLVILLIFMLVFGGGAILKKFGLIGVVGLVVAFWLLGDIEGAVMPIVIIILVWIISVILERRK